jgi:hypothetical protein
MTNDAKAPPDPATQPVGKFWQDVVIPGEDWVWAHHDSAQDLTGKYGEITYTLPDGGTLVQPAADIVQTPPDFIYAYDDAGRMLDPRRFAGEGGTPITGMQPLPAGMVVRSSPPVTPRPVPRPSPPPLPPAREPPDDEEPDSGSYA